MATNLVLPLDKPDHHGAVFSDGTPLPVRVLPMANEPDNRLVIGEYINREAEKITDKEMKQRNLDLLEGKWMK